MLREEMRSSGVELINRDRRGQNHFANSRRADRGGDYFVQLAFAEVSRQVAAVDRGPSPLMAISGIYTVTEATRLQHDFGGVLIYVDAPAEERFARLQRRADGPRDAMTRSDFDRAELRETSGLTDDDANLHRVRELSRYEVNNVGTLTELEEKVERLVRQLVAV